MKANRFLRLFATASQFWAHIGSVFCYLNLLEPPLEPPRLGSNWLREIGCRFLRSPS